MPLSAAGLPSLGLAPTASNVIANHLRDAIVSGAFAEGEPIRQDEVARMFGVSKIPVREALKRLEAEGLVAFSRNRGAVVASITDPEIAQILEVRAILECAALKFSVPQMTEQTFQRAERYCDAFNDETDVARFAELNWSFHSCLFEDARRPFLLNLIRSLNDKIERYLRIQMALSATKDIDNREHREILAACRAGDADLAASLLNAHILAASESLLKNLALRGAVKGDAGI